jgi:hypothetical protein
VTKFCKNCRHFLDEGRKPEFALCAVDLKDNSDAHTEWLVTGEGQEPPMFEPYYCYTARSVAGKCGPSAKLWEAADGELEHEADAREEAEAAGQFGMGA